MTIRVERYDERMKEVWNSFVANSKNGVFLFNRNYMDYHSDRFKDHSLMFYDSAGLLCIMPAAIKDDTLYSHNGLTYGGIISNEKMSAATMLEVFAKMREYLSGIGVKKLIYKPVPHIYHSLPAEEDLYALFRNKALLIRRDVSSTIFSGKRLEFTKERRYGIRRCKASGIEIRQDYDFKGFMKLVEEVLASRHNVKPVHTGDEMELLASRFPENIKLFCAFKGDKRLAGAIVYESQNVAHVQYMANSDEGRKVFALDGVVSYLIDEYYKDKRYFDFGISTESQGWVLNEGLIRQKEGFGARATVYDMYEMLV